MLLERKESKMVFFSLIIPVYNVEKYLEKCVSSVINQHPEDNGMEVILVDDGSTDNSGLICDRYAKEYPYIRSIHKKNGGSSSARNEGINQASGKYILFMDSDDWWNPDVSFGKITDFVRMHEQTDMFLFTAYDYIENKGYYKRNDHDSIKKLDTSDVVSFYRSLLDNGNLEVAAYTKIVNRAFLQKNKLLFKEGITGEDNEWMIRLLRKLENVLIIDTPLYIYRMFRDGSVVNTIGKKNIDDLLSIIHSSQKYYDRHPKHRLKQLELCYSSYLWFSALGLSTLLDGYERKMLKNMFFKTSAVCEYSKSPKTRTCYIMYKLLGLTITAKILGIYIRLKRRYQVNRTRVPDLSEVSLIVYTHREEE